MPQIFTDLLPQIYNVIHIQLHQEKDNCIMLTFMINQSINLNAQPNFIALQHHAAYLCCNVVDSGYDLLLGGRGGGGGGGGGALKGSRSSGTRGVGGALTDPCSWLPGRPWLDDPSLRLRAVGGSRGWNSVAR